MRYVLDLMSDSHMYHNEIVGIPEPTLGEKDVWIFLHAGDWSFHGRKEEATSFAEWLGGQKHHQKIVIPGNHECLCDPSWVRWQNLQIENGTLYTQNRRKAYRVTQAKDIFEYHGIDYVTWDFVDASGLKIYCDPYSLEFFDWAFMLRKEDAEKHWEGVERRLEELGEGLDVVLTHGPPCGTGDLCPALSDRNKMVHVGDKSLLGFCERVQPLLCVSGHIHEGRGYDSITHSKPTEDGKFVCTGTTNFVNASYVDGQYKPHRSIFRVWIQEENGEKRITNILEIDVEVKERTVIPL